MPKILSNVDVVGIVDADLGFRHGSPTAPTWTAAPGSPEGVVTAPIGSLYSRTDGSTDTTLYRKESGTTANGWVATAAGVAGGPFVQISGDTMTGNLGMGQASPTAKLHFAPDTVAAGGILFGADTNLYRNGADLLRTDDTIQVGGSFGVSLKPTGRAAIAALIADNTMLSIGAPGAANGLDGATQVYGLVVSPGQNGTGNLTGIWCQPLAGTAGVSSLHSIDAAIRWANTSAALANGTVLRLRTPTISAGGTITSNIALDIQQQLVAGVTSGWGIYQRGAGDLNYFAGNVGVGIGGNTIAIITAKKDLADSTSGNVYGVDVVTTNSGTARSIGVSATARTLNSGSTMPEMTGLLATLQQSSATGVVGTGYGLRVNAPSITAGGAITNVRGLDIVAQKVTGVTNAYGIYQSGVNDLNFFAGEVQAPLYRQSTGPTWSSGTGDPENTVIAPVGSIFSRTDGGTNTTLYRKESAVGSTGWVAVSAGAGAVTAHASTHYTGGSDPLTGRLALATGGGNSSVMLGLTTAPANAFNVTAVGVESMRLLSSTSANNNTAVGYRSLTALTTGADNIGIGASNGTNLSTGNGNTIVGNACVSAVGCNRTVAFGYGATATQDDVVALGPYASATHTGSVAVAGTTTAANDFVLGGATHLVRVPNKLGVGVVPTSRLSLAADTAASGGIAFGTDTNLYRSAADRLRTDDTFNAPNIIGGTSTVTGIAAVPGRFEGAFANITSWGNLVVLSNDAQAIDKGGSISLGGVNATASAGTPFARIAGQKENATDGDTAGYLSLATRPASGGSMAERMRITSDGRIILSEGVNLSAGTVTGTKIGVSATQKLGFWNATPVVQNTGWSVTAGYTAQRSFNPETATLYDVARVLGTLVDQLKTYGLVG